MGGHAFPLGHQAGFEERKKLAGSVVEAGTALGYVERPVGTSEVLAQVVLQPVLEEFPHHRTAPVNVS
jgi:hypothetical protein